MASNNVRRDASLCNSLKKDFQNFILTLKKVSCYNLEQS